jgi:hypothetical protein
MRSFSPALISLGVALHRYPLAQCSAPSRLKLLKATRKRRQAVTRNRTACTA